MSDLQREKFEVWCENEQPHVYIHYLPKLRGYSNGEAELAWQAWQAAIECTVDNKCNCDKINTSDGSDALSD